MKTAKVKTEENALWETIKVIIQALLLAFIVRTFLFQPFTIPSGSMKSNLLIGDYLFVSKYSYGFSKHSIPYAPDLFSGRIMSSNPERGDVAVFKLPSNPSIDYIKRVVGLPGDKIQMKQGVLFINGTEVKKERIADYVDPELGTSVPMYKETLPNGVEHTTLDLTPLGNGDNTGVFEVPAGHYFMMGDNRDNSLDSRFDVGFVPLENFVGPAKVIFFSVSNGSHPLSFWKWPSDMRFDRFFKGI
ncbi:MAG: signal peptidase I [Nitratireductor sp.]